MTQVDPSKNIAKHAMSKGLVARFFTFGMKSSVHFNWYDYSDDCSYVWFSLEIQNETFEGTAMLADNLCTGLQDADAKQRPFPRVSKT